MNRIDRLLGILTYLQSRKFTTAEKIAERFEISVRTVYRDIKALNEQGIPIGFDAGKGYHVLPGYFLPPVTFTETEANALLLMENLAYAFGDKSIKDQYSSALTKIKNALRHEQRDQIEALSKNIKWQFPDCINREFEYLSILQTALSKKHIVVIEYKNNKSEVSKREIEPIGLVFYAFGWHLIGWCHKRRDYRDFKVERIITLKNSNEPFVISDHKNISDYMTELPVKF
jgi:predicted DNA-binding transcriptional regulator YafY